MQTFSTEYPDLYKVIPLADDTAEILLTDNIQEEQNGMYTYDLYIMRRPYRGTLESDVAENYQIWLDAAKAEEAEAEKEEKG